MNIGIEGEDERCWVVIQFDDGERAVKGPMPEVEAQAWINGIISEMDGEGFGGAVSRTGAGSGTQLPQGAVLIGTIVTVVLVVFFLLWVMK